MKVIVEFPIAEAEIMLTALQNEDRSWIDADPTFVAGCERLARAVSVERGPSGGAEPRPTIAERAEQLVGRDIHLKTTYGREVSGLLARTQVAGVLIIETPDDLSLRKCIPLGHVADISEAVAA